MVRIGLALIFAVSLAGCSVLPGQSGERRQTASAPSPARGLPAPVRPEVGQCLAALDRTGATYSPVPDRYVDQGCSILGSVQLASLPSDRATLAVTNLGPVTCEVSQAFTGWARFGVDRAAREFLGAPVRSIETFGSFACRNVAGSGRRSAHATGAAIDVSGFVLEDGRRITVKNGWNGSAAERAFLRTVQQSACKRFDTVLGPAYNAAHEDHLHVEGVISGKSYCR